MIWGSAHRMWSVKEELVAMWVVGCAAEGCPLARVYRRYVRRSLASLPGAFSQNRPTKT